MPPIKSAKFYEDGEGRELPIPEPRFEATATEVTTDFMVTALYKHKGTVALVDPAAFSKPAGGYEEGSFGPEQALCSESNLYPVLSGLKKEYYDKNRGFASGQIYNDHAMYLSDVTFTRNGSIRKAGVVVIAAPNRTRALENHRSLQFSAASLLGCPSRLVALEWKQPRGAADRSPPDGLLPLPRRGPGGCCHRRRSPFRTTDRKLPGARPRPGNVGVARAGSDRSTIWRIPSWKRLRAPGPCSGSTSGSGPTGPAS